MSEWHPTRNGDLDPYSVKPASERRVWWRCAECGHEWQATPGSRSHSPRGGCRHCAVSRAQRERWAKTHRTTAQRRRTAPANAGSAPGGKRLADGTAYFGELGELAYDPHEDRTQCHLCGQWFRLLGSSHLRRTHGWTLAEYRDAFHLPRGAAACSRALSETLRASAKGRVGRDGFGVGDSSRLLETRARVPAWRSLAALAPELVDELHPTRNPDLDPGAVAAKAHRRAWWRCRACGHEWQAIISSRTNGRGCPACSARAGAALQSAHKRVVARERSLAINRPDLLAEWHRERNANMNPYATGVRSQQRAWWRCADCGHEWRARVGNRERTGCPACAERRRSLAEPERSLAVRRPGLLAEWHPERNANMNPYVIAVGSPRKAWWRCARCGHEWQSTVKSRAQGTGCPACWHRRRRELLKQRNRAGPERSLGAKHPGLLAEWHPERNANMDPYAIAAGSPQKAWWRCAQCGHEWQSAVKSRAHGTGCPACWERRRASKS